MTGAVFQINTSRGGVPKFPLEEAYLEFEGVTGDFQANRKYHGGPERAVCLFSLEQIQELQIEGHPIFPGSVGENLTLTGLEWSTLSPGTILRIGDEAILQVTTFTVPCKTIAKSFINSEFNRISQKLHPGNSRVYARVLQRGALRKGQRVTLLNRLF
jgi:MOSC domain-containing protein YiiM